jgi:hypothetical protein
MQEGKGVIRKEKKTIMHRAISAAHAPSEACKSSARSSRKCARMWAPPWWVPKEDCVEEPVGVVLDGCDEVRGFCEVGSED